MIITIDDAEVRRELSVLTDRLSDFSTLYTDIGMWQQNQIRERIELTKVSPTGGLWREWSLRRLEERRHAGNIAQGLLWDTGNLLNSIVAKVGDGVEIGTNVGYARFLQRGTKKMYDRPFIGWSPEDIAEVERMSMLFMEGKLV